MAKRKRRSTVDKRKGRNGVSFQLKLICCGNDRCLVCRSAPAHGPYWYGFWKLDGETRCVYVGRELGGDKAIARLKAYGKQDCLPDGGSR